ncbi:hypothetical protein M405DRAFT_863245 [Rhizopogon salebrosus TDB-379]|nr:hypothetical protein M405DRAFT_863245 [Rhizopogon salebrosus TDB-379]
MTTLHPFSTSRESVLWSWFICVLRAPSPDADQIGFYLDEYFLESYICFHRRDPTSKKFRPAATRNGRNIYAHRWLKQLAPHGSSHEFKVYWSSLGKERRQKCDAEATKLVSGYCKERDSPDDGFPLYRFDVPLPFFALTILRRYISMSVALVTLVN